MNSESSSAVDYDVIVVGGGPGGTAAAIACCQAQLRVALLEQCPFPRDHPGETLHPGVEPLLKQLGVWTAVEQAGFLQHAGIFIDWGEKQGFEPFGADAAGIWWGFQAWRAEFDAILLAQARHLGVTIFQPCRALSPIRDAANRVGGVVTRDGQLRSRFVIDATGYAGWLAHHLSLTTQKLTPPLRVGYGYVRGEYPARDEYPSISARPDGWLWTAKVRPQLYQWTRLEFESLPNKISAKPDVFQHLTACPPGGVVDVTWRWVQELAGLGYFMVGDAATVLDPAASHGVLKALMTGIMSAHLIVQAMTGAASEASCAAEYRAWVQDWFYHDVAQLKANYQKLSHPPPWAFIQTP